MDIIIKNNIQDDVKRTASLLFQVSDCLRSNLNLVIFISII